MEYRRKSPGILRTTPLVKLLKICYDYINNAVLCAKFIE